MSSIVFIVNLKVLICNYIPGSKLEIDQVLKLIPEWSESVIDFAQ